MDFKDQIKQLGDRVLKLKDSIQTEEATKNAFIMPFIQCLGYDVFNPTEVVPEFVTDIGTKKGEKIDYAIFKDKQPTMLVECKHWAQNLDLHDGQLLRYFHVSNARFGILTNGIQYRFYTDLVEPNKMDEKPFFEFLINDMGDGQIEELKKFHKHYFDFDKIVSTASELKYTNEIKSVLNSEFKSPSEAFIKFFVNQVYTGRATEKIMHQFSDLVKKSCNQVISDIITERLKTALNKEAEATAPQVLENTTIAPLADEKKVDTTVEEMEAYLIVKSIIRKKVELSRICYRDYQNFFGILLDDTNRKTICKFYLNDVKKGVMIPDMTKNEIWYDLHSLDDIFKLIPQLELSVDAIENKTSATVNS